MGFRRNPGLGDDDLSTKIDAELRKDPSGIPATLKRASRTGGGSGASNWRSRSTLIIFESGILSIAAPLYDLAFFLEIGPFPKRIESPNIPILSLWRGVKLG